MTALAPVTVHVDTDAVVEKVKTWLHEQFVDRAQLDVGSTCCRENTRLDCSSCGATISHWDLDLDNHTIDLAEVVAALVAHDCPQRS